MCFHELVDIDQCELASPKNIYIPLISLCCGKELFSDLQMLFESLWTLMSMKVNITKGHLHAFSLFLGKEVIFRPSNVTWKLMDSD
jgi:hypothetical protein